MPPPFSRALGADALAGKKNFFFQKTGFVLWFSFGQFPLLPPGRVAFSESIASRSVFVRPPAPDRILQKSDFREKAFFAA
jgi:hypothetical protein